MKKKTKKEEIPVLSNLLKIEIDKYAIRFCYPGKGRNLFWRDLFLGTGHGRTFQDEVMLNLFEMYNECVKMDIEPKSDEEEEEVRNDTSNYS